MSSAEYEQQKQTVSNSSLVELLDSILADTTVSAKVKKQRLKQVGNHKQLVLYIYTRIYSIVGNFGEVFYIWQFGEFNEDHQIKNLINAFRLPNSPTPILPNLMLAKVT